MDKVYINAYSAVANTGDNISCMFQNILKEGADFLAPDDSVVKGSSFYLGRIKTELPEIKDEKYNLRCNRILLYCVEQIKDKIDAAVARYGNDRVGIVIGTTNSGADEYEL